ncbi:ABC transporter substrate-binding protein [Celerinatantimonas sp. YJH-8]|uniref:ABC transporter substrate-binding protein n=1 Tax=Celerinatantimonas sp. YJH-8 TaxID=3228714 RepID=UPI0038C8F59D
MKKWASIWGSMLLLVSSSVWAQRVVTDQLGRQVTIPDEVNRVVVLQHQTLDILVQLDAQRKIVGVLSSWQRRLGRDYLRLAKGLDQLPMPGDLTQVNIESLLKLKPQVVFVTNYAPPQMLAAIERVGIPVIAISLRQYQPGQASQLNPSLTNEEVTYNQGLKEGIQLIGEVVNRTAQARQLIDYIFAQRQLVTRRLAGLTDQQRPRVYMANPNLITYGHGKYIGLMMHHAGAINVAAQAIKGYKQVSIEQVLQWDPQVILVQHRYPKVIQQIKTDPLWQSIDAVKHQRIYYMPQYAKAWGYPMPEAVAVGELWLAKRLYPQRFADIDVNKAADDYYQRFYRTHYQPSILSQN